MALPIFIDFAMIAISQIRQLMSLIVLITSMLYQLASASSYYKGGTASFLSFNSGLDITDTLVNAFHSHKFIKRFNLKICTKCCTFTSPITSYTYWGLGNISYPHS